MARSAPQNRATPLRPSRLPHSNAPVRVHDFEKRRVIARLHFAALVFHEQMAGLGRAVKVENRHAKNARQNFAMHDADNS